MKKLYGFGFFITFLLLFSTSMHATAYSTPLEFMNLYFDFTGNHEPDFPKDKKTIAQYLIQSEKTKASANFRGPLILFLNSSIYIYDHNRQLLYAKLLRTNRSTGFFELTAISHVGPALAYLAKIKQNGDPAWKPAMAALLADIRKVKTLNAQTANNWLDLANIKPWQNHKKEIHALVDYAMSMAGNYIVYVQKTGDFSLNSVQQQFLNGNKEYPISYNAVMVATFMLNTLENMMSVKEDIAKLKLNWSQAIVIVRNEAGANFSAGLTNGTNWIVSFVRALSNNQLPLNHILIAPYAKVLKSAGENPLPTQAYYYYASEVWGTTFNRSKIAGEMFTDLETIYLPERPLLPGDYHYSTASDIIDFMVRLKHSLQDPREMLSNSVGFWLAGELQTKSWDLTKVEIPGLTTGFPKGIKGYPQQNPEISASPF